MVAKNSSSELFIFILLIVIAVTIFCQTFFCDDEITFESYQAVWFLQIGFSRSALRLVALGTGVL